MHFKSKLYKRTSLFNKNTMFYSKQFFPDSYSVPVKIKTQRPNTNYRYKHFNQIHFTAGDMDQFYSSIDNSVCKYNEEKIDELLPIWKHYSLENDAVSNTFKYIFYKFKKGIFIQIRQGRVRTFLPFSNVYFVNEWNHNIIDQNESTLDKKYWYTNNGIMRFESPINETDTGHCHIKHMFEYLCKHEKIPDVDFFVNKRDFPILKNDFTEPYENIWDSEQQPLVSHKYEKYAPILSMVSTPSFADLSIPNIEDWTRVMYKENIHFASTKRNIQIVDEFPFIWKRKKQIAVFRGSSTGIGTNTEDNTRLRLCSMFEKDPLFDIGITSHSTRHRKKFGSQKIMTPDTKIKLKKFLSIEEQSQYKYIIHVEGHVQAYRLSVELSMGCVILLVDCKYKLWFEHLLKPYIHYVPVKRDLSDLKEKVQWCIDNDDTCLYIAKNARSFYEDNLMTYKPILKYLKQVLVSISNQCLKDTNTPKSIQSIQKMILETKLKPHVFHSSKSFKPRSWFELLNRPQPFHKERNIIFKSKHSTVIKIDPYWVVKDKTQNSIHDAFVSLMCINPILQQIPNFMYSRFTNGQLYKEYIIGETLFEYIKSSRFVFNDWLFMMMNIVLAIQVAQRKCFFTHYDLCPWNIILTRHRDEQIIDYIIDIGKVFRVYTWCVPVIIDYDRSHVVYNNTSFLSHGFDSFQDCICLLVTSIYNICRYQQLNDAERKNILYLFKEILTDDIYCSSVHTFSDMICFVEEAHKYSHIMFSPKGNLSRKTPMDLFEKLKFLYKPSSLGHQQCFTHCVSQIETAEYNNIHGMTLATYEKSKHNFIIDLYIRQRTVEHPLEIEQDEDYELLPEIHLPLLNETITKGLPIIPSNYLDILNMLLEVGTYKHFPENLRKEWKKKISNLLDCRKYIYSYTRYKIIFLQRNNLYQQ